MTSQGLSSNATLACADCGVLGAFAFDGVALCAECYQARGSSCASGGSEADASPQTQGMPHAKDAEAAK